MLGKRAIININSPVNLNLGRARITLMTLLMQRGNEGRCDDPYCGKGEERYKLLVGKQ